jgi:hypothetical protein
MTELEKELLETVKAQKQIHKEELANIAIEYQTQLKSTSEQYLKQFQQVTNELLSIIEEQKSTIEKQNEILKNYENIVESGEIFLPPQLKTALKHLEELNIRLSSS